MREIHGKQVLETLEEILRPQHCAVLSVDLQKDYVLPDGSHAKAGNDVTPMLALLPRCSSFLSEARRAGVFVVHVRLVTLPNGASDSPAWLRTKAKIANVTEYALEGTWGAEFCDECSPVGDEAVVTKYRSSAFVNTTLDSLLRANGIETVVVMGMQTQGCVEATFRDAAYRDYYTVLVEDCVAAYDPRLHEASLFVQRMRHDVATAAAVTSIWHEWRDRDGWPIEGAAAARPALR